ncbi:hypothetical protein F5Y11DRAFT_363878 [Daldinia sp. FL1419]|nr:hypothetical protein F5Y11DRAFT_363878 [Daldinia sp. FL1419]
MLPIIQGVNRHAAQLRGQINNAVVAFVKDIETLLQDNEIQNILNPGMNKARNEFHSEMKKISTDNACQWIIDDFNMWYHRRTS